MQFRNGRTDHCYMKIRYWPKCQWTVPDSYLLVSTPRPEVNVVTPLKNNKWADFSTVAQGIVSSTMCKGLGGKIFLGEQPFLDCFDLQPDELGINPTQGETTAHIPESRVAAELPDLFGQSLVSKLRPIVKKQKGEGNLPH